MTSPLNIWISKFAHFVNLNRRYRPAKFHWHRLSGSNFTRAGGKHPSDLHALKMPCPYRVNGNIESIVMEVDLTETVCSYYVNKMWKDAFLLDNTSYH